MTPNIINKLEGALTNTSDRDKISLDLLSTEERVSNHVNSTKRMSRES